jgi:hypothetical protein
MVRRYFRLRRLILAGLAFAAIAILLAPIAQAKHGDLGFWTERPVDEQISKAGTNASGVFDWTDAGIGAAVVFGAIVVLLAAVALARRYRSRPHPAGLAKA